MISDTVDKVDSVEVVEMVAPDRVSTEDSVQKNKKVKEHVFSYFNQPGSILQIISISPTEPGQRGDGRGEGRKPRTPGAASGK